jgi:hypothetical protein
MSLQAYKNLFRFCTTLWEGERGEDLGKNTMMSNTIAYKKIWKQVNNDE